MTTAMPAARIATGRIHLATLLLSNVRTSQLSDFATSRLSCESFQSCEQFGRMWQGLEACAQGLDRECGLTEFHVRFSEREVRGHQRRIEVRRRAPAADRR